ncbi:serine protease 48-like [Brevipalpus obovatus]|uniref:serine protease 48-like n=1 Tax=Brevipalpus obovatus TaxID=246614 RepID=UPI003D9E5E43
MFIRLILQTLCVSYLLLNPAFAYECGKEKHSTRPESESEVSKLKYPWLVFIKVKDFNVTRGCSGAIIGKKHVLTSLNCVRVDNDTLVNPFYVHAYLGTHSGKYYSSAKIRALNFIYKELQDSNGQNGGDLVTIELEREINLHRKSMPICLFNHDSDLSKIEELTILGWNGSLKGYPQRPHRGRMNLVSECQSQPNEHQGKLGSSELEFCATDNSQESQCPGDIGSPLMWKNEKENRWFLFGVAPSRNSCMFNDHPAPFINVMNYMKKMKENGISIEEGDIKSDDIPKMV